MLNFQGTVYIRNGITYSLPLMGGSIFHVNPGSILIINQHFEENCGFSNPSRFPQKINYLGKESATQRAPEDVKSLLQKICGFFAMKMA